MTDVVVLDYGSGNLRSAQRALERAGARVTVSSDPDAARDADGLVVPGVGAFAACMAGFVAVDGPRLVGRRLAGGRPVLGICVGMQILFERGDEHGVTTAGLSEWPGTVARLPARVLPHMGWNTVSPPPDSAMFRGVEREYFYCVDSYAALAWVIRPEPSGRLTAPKVTWTTYGSPFVSAVENGPLWATQFHPEKSGAAGHALLRNWLEAIP
ncbi:MAG: imidazole glycerol phosphate synthase subunit HisH [bacterium]